MAIHEWRKKQVEDVVEIFVVLGNTLIGKKITVPERDLLVTAVKLYELFTRPRAAAPNGKEPF